MFELLLLPVLLSGAALLAHAHQKPAERLSIMTAKARKPVRPSMSADQTYVDNAARRGMYGLLLGTLGMEKSRHPDLIALAENMVRQNQMTTVQLTSITQLKGMSMAKMLDPEQRRILDQLSQLSGYAFERQFLMAVFAEHQEILRMFTEVTQAAKDKDLQKFASDTLIRLRTHRQLARKAEASLVSVPKLK